jgi:hypothetical protein
LDFIVKTIWNFIVRLPDRFVSLLDWLVSAAERLLVLGFVCVALRTGYQLARGIDADGNKLILGTITENWKAVLILFLIPLFYRTARRFLERARKFAGIEAESEESEGEEEANNPLPGTTGR